MGIKWKASTWMILLLVSTLMLSSCNMMGGSKSTGGQVLTLPIGDEPPNLDPAKSTDTVSGKILNNIMEGLMRNGKDGELILGMAAEEPKASEDLKTYTIKLRDAKWSDGKPVTAQDFEYGWLRALDPKTASEYANILYPIVGAKAYNQGKGKREDVGVKALDAKTLEVKLEKPIPYFKNLLAFTTYFPQRKDIIEKLGTGPVEAKKMVYNGPFVMTDWKHGKSVQIRKNDQYWDKDAVKLQEVNFMVIKDTNTSLNLYKAGEIDYTLLNAEFADQYKNDPEKEEIQEASTRYLELNQKTNKMLKNPKIRHAILRAIDVKTLAQDIVKGGAVPAGALIPPAIQANEGKKFREIAPDHIDFNPAEAKKLLKEGLKELGMSQPTTLVIVGDDNSVAVKILTFIKEQLRVNLGVDVQIISVPFKQRLQRSKEGDFDLLISGWSADYNHPMTFMELFRTTDSFNRAGYSNKQYDALIKQAAETTDKELQLKNFIKAEKILIDDAGLTPLFYRATMILKKPYVKGIVWHPTAPEMTLKWAEVEGKK